MASTKKNFLNRMKFEPNNNLKLSAFENSKQEPELNINIDGSIVQRNNDFDFSKDSLAKCLPSNLISDLGPDINGNDLILTGTEKASADDLVSKLEPNISTGSSITRIKNDLDFYRDPLTKFLPSDLISELELDSKVNSFVPKLELKLNAKNLNEIFEMGKGGSAFSDNFVSKLPSGPVSKLDLHYLDFPLTLNNVLYLPIEKNPLP